jgi:hypothetical protein
MVNKVTNSLFLFYSAFCSGSLGRTRTVTLPSLSAEAYAQGMSH